MELQEKQGSIGDLEKEEECVCKEMLAEIKKVLEARGLAFSFKLLQWKSCHPFTAK